MNFSVASARKNAGKDQGQPKRSHWGPVNRGNLGAMLVGAGERDWPQRSRRDAAVQGVDGSTAHQSQCPGRRYPEQPNGGPQDDLGRWVDLPERPPSHEVDWPPALGTKWRIQAGRRTLPEGRGPHRASADPRRRSQPQGRRPRPKPAMSSEHDAHRTIGPPPQ